MIDVKPVGPSPLSLSKLLKSRDGTTKFVFSLAFGGAVESVLIPMHDRITVCVSSEVGCKMGCAFCLTAKHKLARPLSTEEILEQLRILRSQISPEIEPTSLYLVFMGMGEPLNNIEAVSGALETWWLQNNRDFTRDRVTISTSGVAPKISRVTQLGVNLAVSLNATTDETRNQLMPVNRAYPIENLLAACRAHTKRSRRTILFEYVLLENVNMGPRDARRLRELLWDIPAQINLIPFNWYPGAKWRATSAEATEKFLKECLENGLNVSVRESRGQDIYAACGQLYPNFQN